MDKSLADIEAREADPASFDAFYQAEYAVLFRSLLLLTGERAEAEDVTHEAFVRVLERWERVVRMEAPRAYLYRIALNLHRNGLRRRWREARRAIVERGVLLLSSRSQTRAADRRVGRVNDAVGDVLQRKSRRPPT